VDNNRTTARFREFGVFLGKYQHVLDAKGRLAVPARFRTDLATGAVVTRGADRCLAIYPADYWQQLCARIAELPVSDADVRTFRRFVFSEATELEIDGQGRILIPLALRQFAGLDRNVVIVGMDSMVEVWSESAWDPISRELDEQSDDIVTRLASMI
jgi:MraZ protein